MVGLVCCAGEAGHVGAEHYQVQAEAAQRSEEATGVAVTSHVEQKNLEYGTLRC